MRIRIAFTKKDEAKYIAHLDLIRLFDRALRRASIRMAYSEGFNPHPKISFASALAVGVEGEREYVDLELKTENDLAEVLTDLQKQLPLGILILEGQRVQPGAKALMSAINAASYRIYFPVISPIQEQRLQEAIHSWLNREHVMFTRSNKKGPTEKDIRPWVKNMSGSVGMDEMILELDIEMGSQGTVRPEEVVASLADLEDLPIDLERIRILRTGMYIDQNGKKRTPFEENTGM